MQKGTKEFRISNINYMLSWSLDQKINHSLKRIKEFYSSQDGKVYVSFSGGRDSTVLLHLVRSIYPDIVAVFVNTTNEYMEILDFVRSVPNVVTLHPKMTFSQTIEKYGFPLISKEVAQKVNEIKHTNSEKLRNKRLYGDDKGYGKLSKKWHFLTEYEFDVTSKCCDILKKNPCKDFEKKTGLFPFVGTMIEESSLRKSSWIKEGCNVFSERPISKPLSIWTKDDIDEYLYRFSVPCSKIYDDVLDENGNVIAYGEKRTGCAYCAFGAHLEKEDENKNNKFYRLAKRKPHQFKKMMALENNGRNFAFALNKIGIDVYKYIDEERPIGVLFDIK